MHVIIDSKCPVSARTLGSHGVHVSALFNSPIKPSQRKGVNVNSNALFNLTNNKAELFSTLQEANVPVPEFVRGEKLYTPEGFDYLAYDRKFENSTAVLRTPVGTHTIMNYSDLVKTLRVEHEWSKSVMYKQVNDFMYEVEITCTRHKSVLHRSQRRDHILETFTGNHNPTENTVVAMETVATDIALTLEADFIRVKMVWFLDAFYVVDVTTGLTEDTALAASSVIQRMVAMRK
jgi:hypothetical protein